MFDIDKFIQLVEEKPALWEKSAKEYSDKNCRNQSWTEIGEMFFEDWPTLTAAERNGKGVYLIVFFYLCIV